MSRIGLTLNEQKTSIRDALAEDFDFLGYTFGPRYWWKTGQPYTAARPSQKSIQRLTAGVYELLKPCEQGQWPEVCQRLNAKLQGWQNYFCYGSVARGYHIVNRYVEQRGAADRVLREIRRAIEQRSLLFHLRFFLAHQFTSFLRAGISCSQLCQPELR
jgi:RNA-directed DNA polymerase